MIRIEEVPDTNFLNFSNTTLTGHTVVVTDTIDNSSITLLLDGTEQSDIEMMR